MERIQLERDSLSNEVDALRREKIEREKEMNAQAEKFEKLSAQAFRKIQELLAERGMLEVEVDALRSQVNAYEEHMGIWMNAEQPVSLDAPYAIQKM
jgi:uncharacterized coiled-coil DUF342 family protein